MFLQANSSKNIKDGTALYSEKAKAARTFKRWRDVVTHDPKYISMRKMWREYENHNLQEIQ